MLDKVKELSLFLLAAAVGCGEGRLMAFAGVLALGCAICDKDRFCNLKNKYFKITLILLAIFVGTLYGLSAYLHNPDGMKDAIQYIERSGTFLVICLFLGRVKNIIPLTAFGLAAGFLVNDVIVIDSWLHEGGRLGGLFGHPNKLGGCILFALPFMVYFSWYFRKLKKWNWVMPVSIVLLLVSLWISGSRGALIGVIWEVVIAICLYKYRSYGSKITTKLVLGTISGLVVGIVLMSCVETFHARSYDHERVLLWTAAWQMFEDHPITGVGLLQFKKAYLAHYITPAAKEPDLPHPHNLFLNFLAETGFPGFAAYMLLALGPVVLAFKAAPRLTHEQGTLKFPEVFIISVTGMFAHGMVDVLATTRDQLLLCFFLWGVICLYLKEAAEFKIEHNRLIFTEHNVFFCDRPTHILNTLNGVWQRQEISLNKTDVFIIDKFINAKEIATRLRAENLFAHVFLVTPKAQQAQEQTNRIVKEVQQHLVDRIKVFQATELPKYMFEPALTDINWQYKAMFVPSWGALLWQELATALGDSCSIYFGDDGFFSYNKAIIVPRTKHLEGKVRKLLGHGKFGFNIQGIFLNNPDLWAFDKSKVYQLPRLVLQDKSLQDCLKRVFAYKQVKAYPYIFVEQNLEEKLNVDLDTLKNDVLNTLVAVVPKEKISFRLHPSQKPFALLQNSKVNLDYGENIWELMWAEGALDANEVLIGYSSTALGVPKLLFDKEPLVICLYRLLHWQEQERLADTERFLGQVQAMYKDQSRFIIVNSMEEFAKALEQVAKKVEK
jgi:O-antigen ligase